MSGVLPYMAVKLEAFEMWCYRRMLKIKLIERITNEVVLDRIKEKRVLWYNIKVRRDKMIWHLLHHDNLLKIVIEGNVVGHIGPWVDGSIQSKLW